MEDNVKLRCLELAHKDFSFDGYVHEGHLLEVMNRAQVYWSFCHSERAFQSVMRSREKQNTTPPGIAPFIKPSAK